jgi:hypothetical protein
MPIPWPGILTLMEYPEALTLAGQGDKNIRHAMLGAIGSPRPRARNDDRSVRVVSRSISRRQLQEEEVITSVARPHETKLRLSRFSRRLPGHVMHSSKTSEALGNVG